jgi:RNA polymerase sigma-70 factor (ECF subfamily)
MPASPYTPPTRPDTGARDLAARIAGQDTSAFETVMREHNGRLFRVARAILKDDAEAEDALQDAYLDAFTHIGDFDGRSALATWLTRIVINRALMRLRKHKRDPVVVPFGTESGERSADGAAADATRNVSDPSIEPPLTTTLRAEVRRLIERRIDALPLSFRTVFVMCEVDEMSIGEVASALSIPAATVRTRLFRARALLRSALAQDLDTATSDVFGFAGARCDRIVSAVLRRMAGPAGPDGSAGADAASSDRADAIREQDDAAAGNAETDPRIE